MVLVWSGLLDTEGKHASERLRCPCKGQTVDQQTRGKGRKQSCETWKETTYLRIYAQQILLPPSIDAQ